MLQTRAKHPGGYVMFIVFHRQTMTRSIFHALISASVYGCSLLEEAVISGDEATIMHVIELYKHQDPGCLKWLWAGGDSNPYDIACGYPTSSFREDVYFYEKLHRKIQYWTLLLGTDECLFIWILLLGTSPVFHCAIYLSCLFCPPAQIEAFCVYLH